MRRSISHILVIVAMLISAPVFAKELKGVTFPDERLVGEKKLVLNGLGLRIKPPLRTEVYVAALYVVAPSVDPASILDPGTPKELTLHYLSTVTFGAIKEYWKTSIDVNVPAEQRPALKARIEKLSSFFTTDLKKEDDLTFTFKPGTGVEVTVIGEIKGTIEGDDFSRALLAVWLGDNPPNPELKKGLLGGE